MMLLSAVAALVLTASTPECATTNIETALRHVFERYGQGGPLEVSRDSGDPITPDFITASLKIRDVPNGYATLEGPDLIETFEAALFKNPEGYHLVITANGGSVSRHAVFRCGPDGLSVDDTALRISDEEARQLYKDAGLVAAQGKKGLSEQTLKDWAGSIVLMSLPRKGRTILLKAGVDEPSSVYGKKLGTVEYTGGQFIVHSLAKRAPPAK
jgi:hypothetical protein